MKDWILSQGLSLYVEIVLLMAGLVTLWITGRNYKRLIREADLMGTSEHRLMKYIKLKVTGYFKIGMHPEDTGALVGRYIKKYRLGPLSLHGWSRLPYLFMTALLTVGGGNFIYRWTKGSAAYEMVILLATSVVGTCILFGLTQFMDFRSKEDTLIQNISDYVSNYLNQKLAFEYKEQAGKIPPEQYKRALKEIAATGMGRRKERKQKYYYDEYGQDEPASRNDEIDAKIVEDVLKEFLC